MYATIKEDASLNKVLVVEDEVFMRRLLKEFLTRGNENAHVVISGSVEEAIAVIEAHDDFGALLTDFDLGDGNGNQVARRFSMKFPNASIYGMTGGLADRFDEQLFKRVLRKPFIDPEDKALLKSLCS